jgi:site-specific recombinase XerD
MPAGSSRRKPGRMAVHIEPFSVWLSAAGYAPGTSRGLLKVMGHLGRWMQDNVADREQLSMVQLGVFVDWLHSWSAYRVSTVNGRDPLVAYLLDAGVVKRPADIGPVGEVEELIDTFRRWMIDERGLAAATVLRYENTARRFLNERHDACGSRFISELTARDVVGFLVVECGRVSTGSAKGRVAELRALLRYLFWHGLTPRALAVAIPPVAGWHGTTIPKTITATRIEELIASCDTSTPMGRRDRAVLLLVARLGLRSVEVVNLQLGDIDWRAGEIVVRGKVRREDRMPLPFEVGEAITGYLVSGRPATTSRCVFLTSKAPIEPLAPARVSDICRGACVRVGIDRVGAHRLRHTLASELLRHGSTIIEVSQVLRHRDLATTAVYANPQELHRTRTKALVAC